MTHPSKTSPPLQASADESVMGQIDADLRAHLVAIYRRMCAAMLVTALVALVFGVELAAFSRGAPTASRSGLPPRDGADLKLGPQVSWHLQIRK